MNWVTAEINGQEVSIAFDENSVHIYNAYPIKDDLKSRGYRWNPTDKSWFIKPGSVDSEIEILKNNLASTPVPTLSAEKPELAQFPVSFSVSDLRNRLDQLIKEGIRGNVWVRGVVASEVKNYKWAAYLDLKDEDETRDIFFRVEIKKSNLEKIEKKLLDSGVAQSLERDLPVFCNVEVHLPLRNVVDIRLSLLDILPEYTQSRIRNQRDITLGKLSEEGILGNQKQLIVPIFISRIGLITSEQGAAVKDIKAGLYPYENKYEIYFVDSRMEGTYAVDNIIQAISYFETDSRIELDVLVIARGGGSEQSLAVFNDLELCRKVCRCPIPIVTAIGHEKDVSAIEQCSWLTPTPSTPSGVGKYLQNRYLFLQEQLSGAITQIIHHFTYARQREIEKIKSFLKNIPARVSGYFRWKEERFFSLTRGLDQTLVFTVRDQEQKIRSLSYSLLSRVGTLQQRTLKHVEKSIEKLDFERQKRRNIKHGEDTRKKAQFLFTGAVKKLSDAQKELNSRTQLVQASDPLQILKKGFSLTLDEENRVIKSFAEFDKKEKAFLKFYDGVANIRKNKSTEEI